MRKVRPWSRWRLPQRLVPQSLLGRLSLVMVLGVMLAQLAGNAIWARQLRIESEADTRAAAEHLARSAAATVRYFVSLPANYRPLVIQQFRGMGGTRFFVNLNRSQVAVAPIEPNSLASIAVAHMGQALQQHLASGTPYRIALAWPATLDVSDTGTKVGSLPDSWVEHILLTAPKAAPIMVIQVEMEPGRWLYLAGLMPDPYFLEASNPMSLERLQPQLLSLAAVLLLTILVVRSITRPLEALSQAAEAIGNGEHAGSVPLPQSGSREFVNTARAFAAMRERIATYLKDRDRLFVSISHDLRTPIMRLKLRAELLDDDALRGEFHEDLDDLDMMVKGALQCVRDSDIHENPTAIKLDLLINRIVRGARLAAREVSFADSGVTVTAKPLALKRALGNLLDNALHYGERAEIEVQTSAGQVHIRIRDHGPGVPEDALRTLAEPYVRLDQGRQQNPGGMGLGLGIARDIVQGHHGRLELANHAQGGLVATIILPT